MKYKLHHKQVETKLLLFLHMYFNIGTQISILRFWIISHAHSKSLLDKIVNQFSTYIFAAISGSALLVQILRTCKVHVQ